LRWCYGQETKMPPNFPLLRREVVLLGLGLLIAPLLKLFLPTTLGKRCSIIIIQERRGRVAANS